MATRLEKVKASKMEEGKRLEAVFSGQPLEASRLSLREALGQPGLSVIAEVKRASPSAGDIQPIEEPEALAAQYVDGGAAAISVLTDPTLFKGSLDDLTQVARHLPHTPVLRKDFVVHPAQIHQAVHAGASAVLLIVRLLGEELDSLLEVCEEFGIEALVEVHTLEEINIALEAGADMIGVNNRDLETLAVNLATAENLANHLPKTVIKIAESGIRFPEDAQRMARCGYDAVLVGEALVRAANPSDLVSAMRGGGVALGNP